MSDDPRPKPRYLKANRHSLLSARTIDDLVDVNHVVRIVWDYCLELDLTPLYDAIQSVERSAGRPPYDPRVLFALWLYAMLEHVSSARELARRCRDTNAFQWIAGGLEPSYHTLSTFRVQHLDLLDDLLTESIALLRSAGLPVDLEEVAHDGMRVRASAGAASFRSAKTLAEQLDIAHEEVLATRADFDHDLHSTSQRQHAARQRAAHERFDRVTRAIEQLPAVEALFERERKPTPDQLEQVLRRDDDDDTPKGSASGQKKKGKKKKRSLARRSTTDPDARVMKMSNGGFRPAFNFHYAVDVATRAVIGVDLTNAGSDMGLMPPMIEQLKRRYPDAMIGDYLVDGGFAKHEDIDIVSDQGITVLAPVKMNPNESDKSKRFEPHEGDSDQVIAWRVRMASPEAKKEYRRRASTIELVNCNTRNRPPPMGGAGAAAGTGTWLNTGQGNRILARAGAEHEAVDQRASGMRGVLNVASVRDG